MILHATKHGNHLDVLTENEQLQGVPCQFSTYSDDCISIPCNDRPHTIGITRLAKTIQLINVIISTQSLVFATCWAFFLHTASRYSPDTKPSGWWPQVQCGFGRVGSHFWGFELQSVVPDMVTLGKPIGNGFPMGAVVMTHQLAQGFSNGMEYFNTCGGCTGAAAAGECY